MVDRYELEVAIKNKNLVLDALQCSYNDTCDQMTNIENEIKKHQKLLEDLVAQLCEVEEMERLQDDE